MSRQNDLQTNRDVRRVLVRHWIDLGRVSIRTIKGNVRLSGILRRLHSVDKPLTPSTLETIHREIMCSRTVKRLTIDVDNWVSDNGHWKPNQGGGDGASITGLGGTPASKSFIIGSKDD